jgi:BirA family biotin operon repressor/biotin-[acetyl-CoA-carboxylase] ligase
MLSWLREYNLLIFDELDSTNLEAKRLISSGISDNFVICADTQTNGRGRYGRSWISHEGNLHTSILLRADEFLNKMPQLSFVSSLAVYNAIKTLALRQNKTIDLGLKWPNDVLISESKVSGILLETLKYSGAHWLIIGIGVNVKHSPDIEDKMTTSLEYAGLNVHSTLMLDAIMSSFEYYRLLWLSKGFMYIRNLWLKKIYNPKQVITVSDGKNRVSGIFQDIDLSGAIRLKLASGQIYTLSVGEVFFGEK